jgi:uridine kinase
MRRAQKNGSDGRIDRFQEDRRRSEVSATGRPAQDDLPGAGADCRVRGDRNASSGQGRVSNDVALAQRIALMIGALAAGPRPAVAFDGPDAAGKTWLADQVASHASFPVCRASIDGFHTPSEVRRRRGNLSADGYYRDCFDYQALVDRLLLPFRAGAPTVHAAVFDFRCDAEKQQVVPVADRSVLLFDGVFLLRPRLLGHWTLRIYLHVSEEQTMARALRRDLALFGSAATIVERYRRRYLPGQALYRQEARPHDQADIIIDNDDPGSPKILSWNVPTR